MTPKAFGSEADPYIFIGGNLKGLGWDTDDLRRCPCDVVHKQGELPVDSDLKRCQKLNTSVKIVGASHILARRKFKVQRYKVQGAASLLSLGVVRTAVVI